jgi:hypothetical protein
METTYARRVRARLIATACRIVRGEQSNAVTLRTARNADAYGLPALSGGMSVQEWAAAVCAGVDAPAPGPPGAHHGEGREG